MALSAAKSTVTLFAPWTKQFGRRLEVAINGEDVKLDPNPTLLGVKWDLSFTFCAHAVAKKAAARLNCMRALASTEFGKDKECLLTTYKQLIRSPFDFAAPVVFPNYSNSSIRKLQLVQNKALCLALGCHIMSSIDHLHAEAQCLRSTIIFSSCLRNF